MRDPNQRLAEVAPLQQADKRRRGVFQALGHVAVVDVECFQVAEHPPVLVGQPGVGDGRRGA